MQWHRSASESRKVIPSAQLVSPCGHISNCKVSASAAFRRLRTSGSSGCRSGFDFVVWSVVVKKAPNFRMHRKNTRSRRNEASAANGFDQICFRLDFCRASLSLRCLDRTKRPERQMSIVRSASMPVVPNTSSNKPSDKLWRKSFRP